MRLYKVTFTINDSYRPKMEGFCSITLVVSATDQFTALAAAWERVSSLGLPEPSEFTATRVNGD